MAESSSETLSQQSTYPQLRSSRLVPPILESGRLKRKLSVASSGKNIAIILLQRWQCWTA